MKTAVNLEILDRIKDCITKHPDWRFGQILVNMGIIKIMPEVNCAEDPFCEESIKILDRIKFKETEDEKGNI